MSLRSLDGGNITTFSVDPTRYDPFQNAKRGSSHRVLSGSVIHQDRGLQVADFVINLEAEVTDYVTCQDLWTKFRSQGTTWELRDWFPNRFEVLFAPGQAAFHPVPIRGSCDSFEISMVFYVVRVIQWFGSSY
jgi:hypothetical protein